jgi:hypothetical protein
MAKKKKATRKKKSAGKKTGSHRSKPARGQKKAARRKKRVKRTTREAAPTALLDVTTFGRRGLGAGSAGQSGDTQGLSTGEWADSESVEELVEEGQDFEAGVVAGVEDALDADQGEVRTKQVLEDDVPLEYLDKD